MVEVEGGEFRGELEFVTALCGPGSYALEHSGASAARLARGRAANRIVPATDY
jgi:hypothetical protein